MDRDRRLHGQPPLRHLQCASHHPSLPLLPALPPAPPRLTTAPPPPRPAASPDGKPLDVNSLDLAAIGPSFENNPAFPKRTNTEFVQVLSRSRLRMRVWERGAGPTLACGTGACATVVAAVLEGRADRKCTVDLPGGPLEIHWREDNNRIIMTGPAEAVFAGSVTPW